MAPEDPDSPRSYDILIFDRQIEFTSLSIFNLFSLIAHSMAASLYNTFRIQAGPPLCVFHMSSSNAHAPIDPNVSLDFRVRLVTYGPGSLSQSEAAAADLFVAIFQNPATMVNCRTCYCFLAIQRAAVTSFTSRDCSHRHQLLSASQPDQTLAQQGWL